jgi:hypothetical protein
MHKEENVSFCPDNNLAELILKLYQHMQNAKNQLNGVEIISMQRHNYQFATEAHRTETRQ